MRAKAKAKTGTKALILKPELGSTETSILGKLTRDAGASKKIKPRSLCKTNDIKGEPVQAYGTLLAKICDANHDANQLFSIFCC